MLGNNGSRIASWLISFLPVSRCHGLKRWLLRKIGGIEIGDGTCIWSGVRFVGRYIRIGKNCHFGEGCIISGLSPDAYITIGDEVSCGPQVFMTTGTHDVGDMNRRSGRGKQLPISIGSGTGLSVRCLIMAGVTVGRGCIIGSNVVVSMDVPDNTMLVPAVTKKMKLPEGGIDW